MLYPWRKLAGLGRPAGAGRARRSHVIAIEDWRKRYQGEDPVPLTCPAFWPFAKADRQYGYIWPYFEGLACPPALHFGPCENACNSSQCIKKSYTDQSLKVQLAFLSLKLPSWTKRIKKCAETGKAQYSFIVFEKWQANYEECILILWFTYSLRFKKILQKTGNFPIEQKKNFF